MLAIAASVVLTIASVSSGAAGDRHAAESPPLIGSVLWMGDSIAYDLAPGVSVALEEAGLGVDVYAFAGISLTGGAWLPEGTSWLPDVLSHVLEDSPGDVVVWQLSRFDAFLGHDANLLAHTYFVDLALRDRVAVILVTAPPVRPDAITAGWSEDWADLTQIAHTIAERHPGRVLVADASSVWGSSFVGEAQDGRRLRMADGVHVCPLGATIFGHFLAQWLDERFAGLRPTDPSTWPVEWWLDERYYRSDDACGTG